jgi:hypothetical protein
VKEFALFCGLCSLSNSGKVSLPLPLPQEALCYVIQVTSLLVVHVHSCVDMEGEKAR